MESMTEMEIGSTADVSTSDNAAEISRRSEQSVVVEQQDVGIQADLASPDMDSADMLSDAASFEAAPSSVAASSSTAAFIWGLVTSSVRSVERAASDDLADNSRTRLYFPAVALELTEFPRVAVLPDQEADFAVEKNETLTRLIQLSENGGGFSGNNIECGQPGRIEVYVYGPQGVANKLGNVAVQLVQFDKEGNRQTEVRYTKVDGPERGSLTFPQIADYVEVTVIEDVDGTPVRSETMGVSSIPLHVRNYWLANASYCTDEESCWTLRESNICEGQLSWNIVFKRT